jgi:hypothetical protein
MPESPEYKIAGSPAVAGFIVHRNMRSPGNLVPTKYKGCSQRVKHKVIDLKLAGF